MTNSRVRWGILGVAKINERLIPGFKQAKNAELRAIASRSMDKAKQAAVANDIPVAHGSYEALLDDPTIDAVYIPLPNHLHAEWTMNAAERGKHVLCEKPLASDAAEAQQAVDFCREKKVRLMEGFMWPHHPRTAKLRQLLDSGAIGEVRHVASTFTFQLELDPTNIRLKPNMAGGSVMDVGCYPVYGARWVFGAEPVRVHSAAAWHIDNDMLDKALGTLRHREREILELRFGLKDGTKHSLRDLARVFEISKERVRQIEARAKEKLQGHLHDVDLSMSALLEFPDDQTALFDCGFTLPFRQWLEITGTEGKAWLEDIWLPAPWAVIRVQRGDKPVEKIVIEGEDQIVHMIQNFSAAVLEGGEVMPGPEQGVATMKVLDALRRSAREGRAVEVR
jgi:RNA polymerase sigma factor (sigma-70 family)